MSLILAAQDSDENINRLTIPFFEKYPDWFSLMSINASDLYPLLDSITNFKNKANWIIDLAKEFHVSVPTVRTWERDKASPSHEVLIALCKRYGTSADYLLGLTDIDPSDEARKQRQRLTEEEQNEMHRYEEYLLWKRKK